jgi:hypothetical protein
MRYWDGAAWTDRVQPKNVPPPPPPGQPWSAQAPPPPPNYAPQPPGYGPTQAPPGQAPPGQAPLVDPWAGYSPAPAVATPAGRLGPDGQILAGWWRRAGGFLIDTLIIAVPTGIIWGIATVLITSNGGEIFNQQAFDDVMTQFENGVSPSTSEMLDVLASGFWATLAVATFVWLAISLVNGVYLISKTGQTIGDRAVHTRKVMAGRTVPGFGRALARWLIPNVLFAAISNLVPFGFVVTWADYLWPSWDSKSQTLHDKMVQTYVERADLAGPVVPRR